MQPGPDRRDVAVRSGEDPSSANPGGPQTGAPPAPTGETPEVVAGPEAGTDEMQRLRAERDAAVKALDRQGRRDRRWARVRRILVGFLVVLFAVLLPLTATIGWAHNLVLNNNGYVRAVGPLASNPAVTSAVSRELTDEVFTALNPQAQIAGVLPPKASFLAAPITNGVKGYVQTAVNDALGTKQFQTIWVQANRIAHQELVNVLRGHSRALSTTNGQVVLNLIPLLNAALQQVEPFISGVVGKPVNLPTVSASDVPASACQKISSAIGRPLPSNCAQIPLFPSDKLTQAQRLVRVFDGVTILLLVLTPVVAAVALWVSRRRRRTVLQLTVAGLLGLVVIRRTLWWLEGELIKSGKPENKAARQAIVDQVTHGFFTLTTWLLVGLAVILAVTLFTGPYAWARQARGYLASAGRWTWRVGQAAVGRARDEATAAWLRSHVSALRVGGVVLAVLLMLIFSVSFVGFLVIAALLAAYEILLGRMWGSGAPGAPPGEGAPPSPTGAEAPGGQAAVHGSERPDVDLRS